MRPGEPTDEEILAQLGAPEDSLKKQKARNARRQAQPRPTDEPTDEEIIAQLSGVGPKPSAPSPTSSYSLTDYAGENKAGPYSPRQQADDTRERAEANARLMEGGGPSDLMDGGTQAQRAYIQANQKRAGEERQETEAKDFSRFALGNVLGGVGASALQRLGVGPGVSGAVGGAVGNAIPTASTGAPVREVAESAVLGGVMGGISGPRAGKPEHAPRTPAEIDAAIIQRGKQLHPDQSISMAMRPAESLRLAKEANALIDREQAPRIFRRDQLEAEVKNRDISDRTKAGNVERDWRAALDDAKTQNRKTLDEPERAVIEGGPVDTIGHRGMLKGIVDETMGPAGSVLPKVQQTVEGARAQMQRPVLDSAGKPVLDESGEPTLENSADPRVMILQREKLNQDARRSARDEATLEETRLRNAASIVSDLTAPQGSPYRMALDAYGKRKDYLGEVKDTLGPEGSLEPYRNPNASDPRAAELEGARAEVDAIDKLRGPESGRVEKLAGVAGGNRKSTANLASDADVADLMAAEPAGNKLIDLIKYNNTQMRRGIRVPYLSSSLSGNAARGVLQNLGNLNFKLNPPKIDASGNVAGRAARYTNPLILPLELQLLMNQQQEERR